MKQILYLIPILLLQACDCADSHFLMPEETAGLLEPPQVLFPEGFREDSRDYELSDFRMIVTVVFDQPIDRSTVIPGESMFLREREGNIHLAGELVWNDDATSFTYTTTEPVTEYCDFSPDCSLYVQLELLGRNEPGETVIRSAVGVPLQGDPFAGPGSNYFTIFRVIIIG